MRIQRMERLMQVRLLVTVLMASAVALGGCAGSGQSSTPTASPTAEAEAATTTNFPVLESDVRIDAEGQAVTQRMASVPDCGNSIAASRLHRMTVTNYTDRDLMLYVPNIDCYDWFGTSNPYQFTNQVLKPGQSVGPVTLEALWSTAGTRAFDLDIFDCENAVDGVQFCTIGRVRPVLQQADIVCSDGGGYTLVCDGRT